MVVAQDNEAAPTGSKIISAVKSQTRGLGDVTWGPLDVTTPTGDIRCLGCEIIGTDFFVTGAFDFTIAYLHKLDSAGNLQWSNPQPPACWGAWGWRDLAFDGTWLYAGSDTDHAYEVTQIDPADGSPTGTYYGPYPINPCRALAWDPGTTCFWTASFGSDIYQCDLGGGSTSFPTILGGSYGAAMVGGDLWMHSQDGIGELWSELTNGNFTGVTFDGAMGGIAGGACAHDLGGGMWELIGLSQTTYDSLMGYECPTTTLPLECDTSVLDPFLGGDINFSLDAGVANAGRNFCLLMSATPYNLGINCGGHILEMDWDFVTGLAFQLTMAGGLPFMDTLGAGGDASVLFTVPAHTMIGPNDITIYFGYTLFQPFGFVSNVVDVLFEGYTPPTGYKYDDGSTENALGWNGGGNTLWMHNFDAIGGTDTIDTIDIAFGYNGGPGTLNGLDGIAYVYEESDTDRDPTTNATLVATVGPLTITGADTDTFMDFDLTTGVSVTGSFFIAAYVNVPSGSFAAGMDYDSGYTTGDSWFLGYDTNPWDPDPSNFVNLTVYEMSAIGYPYHWMIRGNQ